MAMPRPRDDGTDALYARVASGIKNMPLKVQPALMMYLADVFEREHMQAEADAANSLMSKLLAAEVAERKAARHRDAAAAASPPKVEPPAPGHTPYGTLPGWGGSDDDERDDAEPFDAPPAETPLAPPQPSRTASHPYGKLAGWGDDAEEEEEEEDSDDEDDVPLAVRAAAMQQGQAPPSASGTESGASGSAPTAPAPPVGVKRERSLGSDASPQPEEGFGVLKKVRQVSGRLAAHLALSSS